MSLFDVIKYPLVDLNSLGKITIPKEMWDKFYAEKMCSVPNMTSDEILSLLKKIIL